MKEKYDCDNQVCWINTSFVKNIKNKDITHFTFRPKGPKGKYDWLSTSDIDRVMKQYESKYKDFKFLGAVPYDFEDLPYLETYKFDLNKLKSQGKNRVGMVVNLDTHDKDGSHWVAFYSNLKSNKYIFSIHLQNNPVVELRNLLINFLVNLAVVVIFLHQKIMVLFIMKLDINLVIVNVVFIQ